MNLQSRTVPVFKIVSDESVRNDQTTTKSVVLMRYGNDILRFSKIAFVFIGFTLDTIIFEVVPMKGNIRKVFVMFIIQPGQLAIIDKKYEEIDVVRFLSYAGRIQRGGAKISRSNPEERPPLLQPSQLQGKKEVRILIVDDESDITLTLRKILLHNGFEHVDTFNDPVLALQNFKPGLYDLVILDIVMSKMDGFVLFERIKEIDEGLKVCFISAFEVNYQALRAVFPAAAKTDDIGCFIRKPIEVQDLVNHVKAELDHL
jgi:CheY-like chemotaxis protein